MELFNDTNNLLNVTPNNKNQKRIFSLAIIAIFSVGFLVGILPDLIAYPFPVGYDVVNYYIPITAKFDQHWSKISNQFPLYALLLHLINIGTGLSPYYSVVISASTMSGVFAISVFLLSRKILNLSIKYSIFLSMFVIFQVAVLRTMWDLHRDLFTLSLMFIIFSLIYGNNREERGEENKDEIKEVIDRAKLISVSRLLQNHRVISYLSWKSISIIVSLIFLSALTASADRMIGGLFTISLIIYSFSIVRTKISIVCASVALCFFIVAALPSYSIVTNGIFHEQELMTELKNPIIKSSSTSNMYSNSNNNNYSPTNLFVLFIVITGSLLPTGMIGVKESFKRKNVLIIPLSIIIILSFSWIVFPHIESLAADRWIILFGIFLSIFAGYGLIDLVQRMKLASNSSSLLIKNYGKKIILLSVLATFIVFGILYEVMPTNHPFVLYGITHNNIEGFVPLTMQINSVDIKDNQGLISAISWINNSTEQNAIIIGEKHWRGFMELYLHGNRTFYFIDNFYSLINLLPQKDHVPIYMIKISDYEDRNDNNMLHFANRFSVYKVEY